MEMSEVVFKDFISRENDSEVRRVRDWILISQKNTSGSIGKELCTV